MVCWKLVRDRIPEKISEREDVLVVQYTGEDKEAVLLAKIVEEAAELAATSSLEEAADLLEALHEWLKTKNYGWEDLERARKKKRELLGGFEKGYVVFWLNRDRC